MNNSQPAPRPSSLAPRPPSLAPRPSSLAPRPSPLAPRLHSELRGEVLTDEVSLGIYATDASLYQIAPLAVVAPRDREDALAAIRICTELGAPIIARGGGTSLSGQAVGRGVVLDVSKHLRRLIELNVEERWCRVEPGLVRDELNLLLKPHGLHFSPDPATSNRANIGGMIANNSGGMRSIRYGTTNDHVLEVEVALAGGETLRFGKLSAEDYEARCARQDHEGEILRVFRKIIEENRAEIIERFPKVSRNSGGYLLNYFTGPQPWNMAQLIGASEGTLGVILEAKLNLVPLPKSQGLCVAHFATLEESLRAVESIVALNPTAVELLDALVLDIARENPLTRELCGFLNGRPGAILIVEEQGENAAEVEGKLRRIVAGLQSRAMGYAWPLIFDAKGQADVWLMRTNGLGLMSSVKGVMKPQPFIEDPAVPLPVLPAYIADVIAICNKYHRPVSVYAHASVGLLHVRPLLDLHEPAEVALMKTISDEVFELVLRYKGSISGEHGDGLVRSHYNERFYGPALYKAFKEIKRAFDPRGLFNPGKVVDGPSMIDDLRPAPGAAAWWSGNLFHYREDGGLRQAVEKCNGVGACRKTVSGVMCPSYIATRDEEHSTRGRANALRLALTGQLGPGTLTGARLAAVLDLCVACKGCVNECPNNVDMSRLKAEAAHQRHLARGTTLRERMFAQFPERARLASGRLAQLVNTVLEAGPVRAGLDALLKIDQRRALPKFSSERLSQWFALRRKDDSSWDRGRTGPQSSIEAPPEGVTPERFHSAIASGADEGVRAPGKSTIEQSQISNFKSQIPETPPGVPEGRPTVSPTFQGGVTASQNHPSPVGTTHIHSRRQVALFNDTYLEHHQPIVGKAAVEVLEAMGFEVLLASAGCCQRPAISKGFLDEAKRKGTQTLKNLDAYARRGIPILVCEPSCASSLAADLPDLIDDAELGARVAAHVHFLEKFIEDELAAGRAALPWKPNGAKSIDICFHGHCHQKAMNAATAVRDLLARIPGARVTQIECGCCGMAGAFGYEKEHYDISMSIGEDRLFPALRAAAPGAAIVADGFSCRHQIKDGVAREARHAIEIVREHVELH